MGKNKIGDEKCINHFTALKVAVHQRLESIDFVIHSARVQSVYDS